MTGTVTNELETNVMNKSSGDLSLNMDISNTGTVGQELGRTVTNQSNCDCSVKDGTNNLKAFGKESPIANEVLVDKEVRREKTENDVVIESDRGENCETLYLLGTDVHVTVLPFIIFVCFLVHFLKLLLHFPREIETCFIHDCLVYVLKTKLRVSLLTWEQK